MFSRSIVTLICTLHLYSVPVLHESHSRRKTYAATTGVPTLAHLEAASPLALRRRAGARDQGYLDQRAPALRGHFLQLPLQTLDLIPKLRRVLELELFSGSKHLSLF